MMRSAAILASVALFTGCCRVKDDTWRPTFAELTTLHCINRHLTTRFVNEGSRVDLHPEEYADLRASLALLEIHVERLLGALPESDVKGRKEAKLLLGSVVFHRYVLMTQGEQANNYDLWMKCTRLKEEPKK
jgi:hypothetical protein